MKLIGIKLLLVLTFSIFLVHDYIPHFHIDEHSEIHRHHSGSGDDHQDPVLSHNVDHVFVSKKHEHFPAIFKVISFTLVSLDLSVIPTKSFSYTDNCEITVSPPILSNVSLRAPPVA